MLLVGHVLQVLLLAPKEYLVAVCKVLVLCRQNGPLLKPLVTASRCEGADMSGNRRLKGYGTVEG